MKPLKLVFSSLILLLLTNSCLDALKTSPEKLSRTKDFQEVNVQEKYMISVPNYMNSTDILNDEASIQYMNALKETYMVVIDEDKDQMIEALKVVDDYREDQSVLDNYARFQTTSIMEGLNVGSKSDIKSVIVDGKSARVFEADGHLDGVPYDIKYILGFTEGKEDVYMIMTWTLKSREKRYSGTLRQIIKSFKEI